MTSTICLVRSGPTSWSAEGRLVGRRDLALSKEGCESLTTLAACLGPPQWTEIITSPMRRAVQTAEILADPGSSIAKDGRLAPVDVGDHEGDTFASLATNPAWSAIQEEQGDTLLGGETLTALVQRVSGSIEQARADNPDDSRLLFVSHQWPIAAALVHYLGLSPRAVARFSIAHGSACVIHVDDITHRATLRAVNWACPGSSTLTPL
ncbi:MAG: histidine phosphatase family protein [Deltaproteobacteria bacterium]|nr:histidine phosphatase family protein [Deltaproteobacteria bacterium]